MRLHFTKKTIKPNYCPSILLLYSEKRSNWMAEFFCWCVVSTAELDLLDGHTHKRRRETFHFYVEHQKQLIVTLYGIHRTWFEFNRQIRTISKRCFFNSFELSYTQCLLCTTFSFIKSKMVFFRGWMLNLFIPDHSLRVCRFCV